ncbi:hypothetical protein RB195_010045 [Necator americanus]|uniref:Uncharacterized protein n=2 Tax=Necator americanus TaxID=51031 RepID=A0ABR1CW47_NECAM
MIAAILIPEQHKSCSQFNSCADRGIDRELESISPNILKSFAMEKNNWGDYYYQRKRPSGKKAWLLEVIHYINQSIPTFSEIFDEETFYVFAFLVVVSSILMAFILSKVVGVTIKEHHININRDWGDPQPANPFRFPWKMKKE